MTPTDAARRADQLARRACTTVLPLLRQVDWAAPTPGDDAPRPGATTDRTGPHSMIAAATANATRLADLTSTTRSHPTAECPAGV